MLLFFDFVSFLHRSITCIIVIFLTPLVYGYNTILLIIYHIKLLKINDLSKNKEVLVRILAV